MKYLKISTLAIWILFYASSCSTSKESFDQSVIRYTTEKADAIRELAEFSVAFTLGQSDKTFVTSELQDRKIRRKFNRNGQGGLVTVTFSKEVNNLTSGLIDSTVIFKQTSLRGVTEIIYDFASNKRTLSEGQGDSRQFVLVNVTDRIYYRRRPVPMM